VLNKGKSLIAVREELEMVSAFLQIQKIRFEDKFDVKYQIDEEIYEFKVVKNILQPIVENALNHGIEPKRTHGTLVVKAWRANQQLCFQVIDDGVGMSDATAAEVVSQRIVRSDGSGYALNNIITRLKAYYGKGHTFTIFSKPGIGTSVTITIQINLLKEGEFNDQNANRGG
jgi:two-component system sensor histidine kinase YesM